VTVQSRVLLLRALRRTCADQSWRAHRGFALLLDRSSVFAVTPPNGDSPHSGFVGYYPHSISGGSWSHVHWGARREEGRGTDARRPAL